MAERAPGFEDYTPSRLEWLAIELNSFFPYINLQSNKEIHTVFIPKEDGKTLVLMVRYPEGTASNIIQEYIQNGEECVKKFAEIHKWDSWVKIEVDQDQE